MAIDMTDYIQTKEKNIKKHKKDRLLFLFDFRIYGKRYRRFYRSKAVSQTAADLLKGARVELERQKELIRSGDIPINLNVGKLFEKYMKTQPDTPWSKKKQSFFDLYIKDEIASIEISKLKPMHIDGITFNMGKRGLSPRTCRSVLEVLNPLFKFAIKNNLIKDNPVEHIRVKVPSQKKKVIDGLGTFRKLHNGIMSLYKNDPQYRALFLFAWLGRRKSEVLNLKWENINLDSNYYWLEDTKNGEDQKFPLPQIVKTALLEMKCNHNGLVFKSRSTGKKITGLDYQIVKLRKETGIENLTLHYMRNILVSALADQSTEAVTLSGILGHKDINTINKYLSNSTMVSGLKGLKAIDGILDVEVVSHE
ncbi:tyrosine-type recombinase/integrase [Sulfurovum sp. CS9]|uniref:tyrosine-type recombinase/integrase n=1 Tax=Sulfurovum sp. CS9 TaxID=3391146 RepID=UPI0039E8F919